ncbi:hypothetical protein F5X96DRAFT_637069 [Biscogniauxia mediterranea]|nr:hypothetical protein F5X96DRAFT_637069 [Biscogniauxia mediterranea]
MPFDFKKYDEKCAGLTAEQLQLEWNRYTRLITSASTSTAGAAQRAQEADNQYVHSYLPP